MIKNYYFSYKSEQGQTVNLSVASEKKVKASDKVMASKLASIVTDATKNLAANGSYQIDVFLDKDKARYTIRSEKDLPIHELSFGKIKVDRANRKKFKEAPPLEGAKTTSIGDASLLERFSELKPRPRGPIERSKNMLASLFVKFLYRFQLMEKVWFVITHKMAKDIDPKALALKWDLNLMDEICERSPPDGMSLLQALTYMSKTLEREKDHVANAPLGEVLNKAAKRGEIFAKLRKHFSERRAARATQEIRRSITTLKDKEDKVLVPAGFILEGKFSEVLLEFSKDPATGKYQVVLISTDDATRDLFDRSYGVEGGSESIRREISNVDEKDLMTAIPTLVELQCSPQCLQREDSLESLFMQALRFPNSTVEVSETDERFIDGASRGRLEQVIAYSKKEQKSPEESARFDLAIRLRLFLDVCRYSPKGLKNVELWTVARTTAYHLVDMIEENKSLLGGQDEQGKELTAIYNEVKGVLEYLDQHLPEVVDLKNKTLQNANGKVEVNQTPPTPRYVPLTMTPTIIPKVEPLLQELDLKDPAASIVKWGERCRKLITLGLTAEAASEAKLMSAWLPPISNTAFWDTQTTEKNEEFLQALNNIGEAIARNTSNNGTIQDIVAMNRLNLYTAYIASNLKAALNIEDRFFKTMISGIEVYDTDLQNCNLSPEEAKQNTQLRAAVEAKWFRTGETNIYNLSMPTEVSSERFRSGVPTVIAKTLNMYQLSLWTRGVCYVYQPPNDQTPINFELIRGRITIKDGERIFSNSNDQKPLSLREPAYAASLSKEIENRYVTETCCLGCTRDNCPNYNMIPLTQHRIHPIYMVHNNVESFCPELTNSHEIHRDELTDLMYTQQSNQNGNELFKLHGGQHGYSIANHHNLNDYGTQLRNTLTTYLEHPNFFKRADLRWHFENKLFKNQVLRLWLEPKTFDLHKPFLMWALKGIKKEIATQNAVNNKETAAYLIGIANKIGTIIENSDLNATDKQDLLALIPKEWTKYLKIWSRELIGKNEDHFLPTQLMIYTRLIDNYYSTLLLKPDDPTLNSEEDLELIISATTKINSIAGVAASLIDPQVLDRCRSVRQFALNKCRDIVENETGEKKGTFLNKILFSQYPLISQLDLKWDPRKFPTFVAINPDTNEPYSFDIAAGKLTIGKMPRVSEELPGELRKSPWCVKVFGEKVNDNWNVNVSEDGRKANLIVYIHPDMPEFRIVVNRTNKKVTPTTPKFVIERKVEVGSQKGSWMTHVPIDTSKLLEIVGTPEDTGDFPLPVLIAIGNRTCWSDSKQKVLYVYEEDGKELYGIIQLKKNLITAKKDIVDFRIVKRHEHLLMADKDEMGQFSIVEDPTFIQVTGNKGRAATVDYMRYEMSASGAPLSYSIGKKEITCNNYPGFSLAAVGMRPGSSDPALGAQPLPQTFNTFQLLQKNGEQKVLIPLLNFKAEVTHKGDTLQMLTPEFSEGFEKIQVYEYGVDQETNRLTAKSGDGYAYLSYLSMAHQDFEGAAFYLSKARTIGGYGENYEKVIGLIDNLNDESPNAIALKLRFHLFHEQILEDNAMQQIRKGTWQNSEQADAQKDSRRIQIADLYKKYHESVKTRKPSETGIDPSLDLNNEELKSVQNHIKTLLVNRGDSIATTNEEKHVRAAKTPEQAFPYVRKKNVLDMDENSVLLLYHHSSASERTEFTLKNPQWINQNFASLFNKIVKAKVGTPEYESLKHQIRLATEQHSDELSNHETEAVLVARTVLMKLITAKEAKDQKIWDAVISSLAKGKLRLPSGKWSSNMDILNEFDTYAFDTPQFAMGVLDNIKKKIDGQIEGAGLIPGVIRYFLPGKKLIRNAQNFVKRSKGANFDSEYKEFLKRKVFGSSAIRAMDNLTNVLKLLEPVTVEQPKQSMAPQPQVTPKPSQTYNQLYGSLVEVEEKTAQSPITLLEAEIAAGPEPVQAELVVTKGENIHPVIEENKQTVHIARFTTKEIPKPDIDTGLFDELSKSDEPAYARVAAKHLNDLNAFLKTQVISATITKGEAQELRVALDKERKELEQRELEIKKNLLQYVERFDTPAGILAMRRLVGKGVKPSLDILVALWRRGETAKSWDDHPFKKMGMKQLSDEVLKDLDNQIAEYLKVCTTHNHFNRLIDMSDNYLRSCKTDEDHSFGDTQLATELYDGLNTKRQYSLKEGDDADFRDLLYVEYSQKIIMYADQIATFREMSHDPNAVRQLRMGRGKTEVIMPILAKKKATGKNLVMLMLPEELYEANCRGLDMKNRILFGQDMQRFEFSRQTSLSLDSLEKIHLGLLQTIQNKGFVMTTKRSLLSLKDSYVAQLNLLTKTPPGEERNELISRIRAMSKIMTLFQEKADVLADEVDACLDVRKEVNFALGETMLVDQIKNEAAYELITMILDQSKETDPLYELRESLLHNTQAALSPERRQELLKTLAETYYEKNKENLSELSKEEFTSYMMNGSEGNKGADWVDALKTKNNEHYKTLTAIRAMFNQGLGMTLGRVGNVNYGRDPVSGVKTIPYKASNTPSINSEFDDDIERISFTYQDYIQNGVSYQQLYQIVANLQKMALEEIRAASEDQPINMLETHASNRFKVFLTEIDPDKILPKNLNLASLCDPKMIATLAEKLNSNYKCRLAYCHSQVVKNMQQYMAQINAMSTEAPGLVRNFGGFTGTPWNIHTYHDKINAKATEGVDGQTWALILGRKVPVTTFAFDADHPIDSLLENTNFVGRNQALVDTGAYLRGTNNNEFVDRVLELSAEKHIEVAAGIYFDQTGKIVKKAGAEGKPLPIELAPITDLMSNVTLYDQAHTVGADIKQGKTARAVVTIGENTFIRDLFQAVWRLRQLHQEQTVELAVSDEIKKRILEGKKTEGGKEPEITVNDIQKFCLMNETRREADDNFKAERGKIQGMPKQELLSSIASAISKGASDETVVAVSDQFFKDESSPYIRKRLTEESFDQYGSTKTLEDPATIFDGLKLSESARCEAFAETLESIHLTEGSQRLRALGKTLESRAAKPADWFLKKVDNQANTGVEVEQEAQTEMELELELLTETETQTQTEVVQEVNIPIKQNGQAGSGDVVALNSDMINLTTSGTLQNVRKLKDAVPFFYDSIFTSDVFERNLPVQATNVSPQSIFYSNRKPVKHVLITKSSAGKWTMIIPTIHEAHWGCRDFIQKNTDTLNSVLVGVSSGRPAIIFKTGKDRTDALPFANEADRKNFYLYYVQAKLFNGEIDFGSPEEQEALKTWLKFKGAADFKRYFEENIISAKPQRYKDRYQSSSLYKILNEMKDEVPLTPAEMQEWYPWTNLD